MTNYTPNPTSISPNLSVARVVASVQTFFRRTVPAILVGTSSEEREFLELGKLEIDDRRLIFQNGIRIMSKGSLGLESAHRLHSAAIKLLHNPGGTPPGESERSRGPPSSFYSANPEDVFQQLLGTPPGSKRLNHPGGVSSLMEAYFSLISLCVHRPHSQNRLQPDTSPYLDLSPLYGSVPEETESLRLYDGLGMLRPDCFFEDRVGLLPPAVSALLVLWNRNHNFIARSLFVRSASKKGWKTPASLSTPASTRKQDDEIFDIAQSINCINFRNTVCEDVLKGLLGLSTFDSSANLDILADIDTRPKGTGMKLCRETSFLYHSSPMMSESDATIVDEIMVQIAGEESSNLSPASFRELYLAFRKEANADITTCNYPRLQRDSRTACFKDEDLAGILFKAREDPACAPGAKQTPPCARISELQTLEDQGNWKICTFNEFRKLYGLKELPSFTAWNADPAISGAAEKLYGTIDKLDLYVGLQCEAAVPTGFGFGYTKTFALIVDLVTRIRSDPALEKENPEYLTTWGMNETRIDRSRPGNAAVLPKILQRNLPRFYPFNSAYTLFLFSTPSMFSDPLVQSQPGFSDYTTEKPSAKRIHTLGNTDAIKHVFNKPTVYRTLYSDSFAKVTNGYGYLLGFENGLEHLHDQDHLMTMYALIPDAGSLHRYGVVFEKLAENAIKNKKHRNIGGKKTRIDIVGDVINVVCTRWVCETLCDYKLADDADGPKLASEEGERNKTAKEMHRHFADIYTFIFKTFDHEDGWEAQRRAIESSKYLRSQIEGKIPMPKWLLSKSYDTEWIKNTAESLYQFAWDFGQIYFSEKVLPAYTAQTFLERVVQASRRIPLPNIHTIPHLEEKIVAVTSKKDNTEKAHDEVERDIEVSRIVANILGLAAVTAVNFSQACSQVVDFYLQEKYATERQEIVRISNQVTNTDEDRRRVNAALAPYIHEALRISQPLGLWREAVESDIISQGNKSIAVQKGDLIFADFHQAHHDKQKFPEPDRVKLDRGKVQSLLGLGMHKCPASSFIDNTMPEVIKAIFRLPNLSRVSNNPHSELHTFHIHPNATRMDPKVFVNEEGEVMYYPQTLILEYDDPSSRENISDTQDFAKKWQAGLTPNVFRTITKSSEKTLAISALLYLLYKTVLILFGIWALIMLLLGYGTLARRPVKLVNMSEIQVLNVECPEPITPWEAWTIATLPAGSEGIPQDLIYNTSLPVAHRLQLYDADKKDMKMAVFVDEILRGLTSDFDLDREEDCSDDVYQCYVKKFSGGIVYVPPGGHSVRISWAGKEVINDTIPDLGEHTARRILWNRDYCGPAV